MFIHVFKQANRIQTKVVGAKKQDGHVRIKYKENNKEYSIK